MHNFTKSFRTRSFRAGTLSLVLVVAVIAVAVVLNIIVSLVPGTYTKLDTTQDKLYALSDDAKELISGYDTDIEIIYIVEEDNVDSVVKELLERAAAINSHITLTQIDPVLHPELVTDYSSYNENSFVVKSDKREKAVDYSEIYQTLYYYDGSEIDASTYQSYMMYYQYGMTSEAPTSENQYAGETVLASAIDYVCTDEIPVIYTLSGHDENSLDSTLSGYLSDDNISVEDLQLATSDSVPEDASAVIINAPQSDLSEAECERLSDYIMSGGHVVVYTYYEFTDLDNLESLMNSFGMKSEPGLIMETDSSMYDSYYYYLYPHIEDTDYTSVISSKYLFAPIAHGILQTDILPDGVSVSALLSTSDGSFARVGADGSETTIQKTDADTAGPFMVGANATYTSDDAVGTLTWYSTPYLAITKYDSNGAVSDLFLATVESGCGISSSVSLATKKITTDTLTVSSSDRALWGFVLIGVLPVGMLVLGLCIWNKRRKK